MQRAPSNIFQSPSPSYHHYDVYIGSELGHNVYFNHFALFWGGGIKFWDELFCLHWNVISFHENREAINPSPTHSRQEKNTNPPQVLKPTKAVTGADCDGADGGTYLI